MCGLFFAESIITVIIYIFRSKHEKAQAFTISCYMKMQNNITHKKSDSCKKLMIF